MRFLKEVRLATVLLIALAAASEGLLAQTQAEITGRVTDSSGAVLPSAPIVVTNMDTGVRREVVTNSSGIYSVPSLFPGLYEVRTEVSGFQSAVRSGIQLQVQQVARIDFELRVGELTQVVEITGGAPLLDTESATMGTVIENKRIVELPLNGRDALQLVALAPNVTYGFGASSGTAARQGGQRATVNISVAGQRSEFNYFTLDGMVNTDPNFNTYATLPSIDALQEFKVQSGVYPAEFGRATTQINVSTKPGGNTFHGTLFEFFRNDNLDASNYAFTVNRPRKEAFVRNQFGFTLGGPVIRNRLFFMANFEALRDRKGLRRNASVPSAAMRQGDFSSISARLFDPTTRETQANGQITASPFADNRIPSSRFNGKAISLLEFYPAPNVPGAGLSLNYEAAESRIQDAGHFITRIDLQQNANSSWFFRFSRSNEDQVAPATFPQQGQKVDTTPSQYMITNTRILSPSTVNDFRFGYSRFLNTNAQFNAFERDVISEIGGIPGVAIPAPAIWGTPSIGISGFAGFGENNDSPYLSSDHIFQWTDSLSLIRGKHSFRFGGEVRRDRFNLTGNQFTRGLFSFGGQATQNPASLPGTGYGFADYMLGFTNSAAASTGLAIAQLRATYQAYYIDDTWKVLRNLTLIFGLRYEIAPPYYDKHDSLITTQIQSLFDPEKRPILVRAGTGDFYEGLPIVFNPAIQIARDGRWGRRLVETDYNDLAPRLGLAWTPSPKWTFRTGFGAFYAQDIGNVVSDLSRNGWGRREDISNNNFPNLTLDVPFANLSSAIVINNPFVLTANHTRRTPYVFQYLLNIQRQLTDDLVLEVGYTGNQGHKLERRRMYNQPTAGPGNAQSRRPFSELGVISITDGVSNSNYNGLSARLQQRFARGLTYLASYTWSRSIDDSSALRAHDGDAGQQPQDSYNMHAERGLSNFHVQHRAVTSLLWDLPFGKGRRFGQSRIVDAIAGGWQLGAILTLQTGLPFTIVHGSDVANAGAGTQRPDATGQSIEIANPGPGGWFNKDAFRAPAPFTFGSVGRNSAIGPGLVGTDFSAHKTFPMPWEGHQLQFRFEAFNAVNRPNFGLPNPTFLNASFSRISSTATTMREIQFGLKYQF